MKKTVQIVTISLGGKGVYKADDLIKKPAFEEAGVVERYRIAIHNFNGGIWQSQQLLVLSDDEIKEEDWFYKPDMKMVFIAEYTPYKGCKKIIASYSQLEGTLPISKETVQAWIDAGVPKEGTLKEALRGNMCLDHQGNLLLEFAQPFKSTMPIYTIPSIPTDEEIEKNSKDYAYAMKGQLYTEKGQHPANTAWSLLSRGYTDGYKQALKDLGHE
jgi:hypothetical protein